MELKNMKFVKVAERTGGVSASTGNAWDKLTFIVEETEGQYPKTIAFETMKKELIEKIEQIPAGAIMNVHFDLSSREYNGRYYTSATCWKFEGVSAPSAAPAAPSAAPAAQYADKLPWE
jgi:hypothetical protein